MLAAQALERLTRELAAAVHGFALTEAKFGLPELLEKQKVESEKLFQGYAKARPNMEGAYDAAQAFLRGEALNAWQREIIASVLSVPIREMSGAIVLESDRFPTLIEFYEKEAERGDLWRLTWHGLLTSYFAFDPSIDKASAKQGWLKLHRFLERTWPHVDRQAGTMNVPDWVAVLRQESEILSDKPAEKYGRAYLSGDTGPTNRIANDLGIPPSSWFWHSLVLGAVQIAIKSVDAEFRSGIPRLIELIQTKPAFRDEAIEQILVRCAECKEPVPDERLRDFVVQPSVWKNPKLKDAGFATAWNRVPDNVWRMVLGWVNEQNLKDFFDILAARNKADEGRLAFWSRYLKQITWTRLVFGGETIDLKNRRSEIRDLIAREEGAYAELINPDRALDAFLMRIGDYIIVEFSKKPNAAYVYKGEAVKFALHQKRYGGTGDDLKYGFVHPEGVVRITHQPGWEDDASYQLRSIDILPDSFDARRTLQTNNNTARSETRATTIPRASASPRETPSPSTRQTSRPSDSLCVAELQQLVERFDGARIEDERGAGGGRLWVKDRRQNALLAYQLEARGFKWAASRAAWYLSER